MKYLVIAMVLFTSGCSFGPIHVTHTYGELPRMHIDTLDDNCKLRPKVKVSDLSDSEIYYKCKWKF